MVLVVLVVNQGRGGVLQGQPVARQQLIKRWHLGHRRHSLATWLLLLQQSLLVLLLDLSRQIILTRGVCLIHHVCGVFLNSISWVSVVSFSFTIDRA